MSLDIQSYPCMCTGVIPWHQIAGCKATAALSMALMPHNLLTSSLAAYKHCPAVLSKTSINGPRSDVVYPVRTIVMHERHVGCAGSPGVRELSVALMPRSLLVFSAEAYTDCLHGIDAVRPAAAVSC